ncbi:hypothetical protein [Burkholderia gladioli]|uniref:hypothetical protein n=1 Tax=Burkholderia gladioli TaxID=28095 RepID=UPI0016415A0A|nr:hypothetical protein [Burkholderia gladioli]
MARAGAATVAAADVEPRNACIAPWLAFRAGRRSRRFAGGGLRGDGMGKPVAGVRAPAVARPGAATVAAADVELRNACIAPWLDVLRGAAVATARGRRPARRRHGKTSGGIRALAVTRSAAATVAAAAPKLRNARIAL